MRIRLAVPDDLDDGTRRDALNAALEAVTRVAENHVRRGVVPPAAVAIKQGRVKWHPEPPGDEHFDLPSTVLVRGHGDCDDLAPWHAGSLRASGLDPGARAFVKRSGPQRWHALVRLSDGTVEDPSLAAGMGHSVAGPGGSLPAFCRPMSGDGRLCIAICPAADARNARVWFARCDVPGEDDAWAGTAAHGEPKQALVRAMRTARHVAGDEIDDEDDLRLSALEDILSGVEAEDIYDALCQELESDEAERLVTEAHDSVGFLENVIHAVTKPFKKAGSFISPFASALSPLFAGSPAMAMVNPLAHGDLFGALNARRGMESASYQDPRPAFERAKEFFSQSPLGPTTLPFAQTLLPTMFPGFGSAFMAMATPQGMPQGMPQGAPAPQGRGGLQNPQWSTEPGVVTQPWGDLGPAFMRF